MGKITNKKRWVHKALCLRPADVTIIHQIKRLSAPEPGPGSMEGLSPAVRKSFHASNSSICSILDKTKTDMLEIVREGTGLKLEMKALKEQFLSLLKNFDMYQKTDINDSIASSPGKTIMCGTMSARSRARALSAARKARLASRRASCLRAGTANIESELKEKHSRNAQKVKHQYSGPEQGHPRRPKKLVPMTPIQEDSTEASCKSAPAVSRADPGEYVMLRDNDGGEYVMLRAPAAGNQDTHVTSIWDVSRAPTAELSSGNYTNSPKKYGLVVKLDYNQGKGAKYASSAVINKLYAAKSIKDISDISQVSVTSAREQYSTDELQGPLHSTVNYPLHSTMNKTQISHFAANQSLEDVSGITETIHTAKTPEPIQAKRGQKVKPAHRLLAPRPKRRHLEREDKENQVPHSQDWYNRFKSEVKTDATFKVPTDRVKSQRFMRPRVRHAYPDTDCDSSYLSEYEYDQLVQDSDDACDYTATYDARIGAMKMLKRQTARLDLEQQRLPSLLSGGKYLDARQKHLSVAANCSSLPDLSALTPSDANTQSDGSDSTFCIKSKHCPSDGVQTPETLQNTLVQNDQSSNDQVVPSKTLSRPPSIGASMCDTGLDDDDNSPPSSDTCGGRLAPLNSPNVTTSSSSRQTSDNYDYVDYTKLKRPNPIGTASTIVNADSNSNSDSNQSRKSHHAPARRGIVKSAAPKPVTQKSSYKPVYLTGSQNSVQGCHVKICDTMGRTQTFVQHSPVSARTQQHDRKRVLVKRMKKFNKNFYNSQSMGNINNLQTLGHF